MKLKIPVNPENLRWARESANLPIDDVAGRMNKDPGIIEEWEDGISSPTYIQLEKLAYEVYKRPIAVFFFPEPPEEISPRTSFRTLPEIEIEQLSPRLLHLFRQAQAMQANLRELNDGRNPADRKIFRDLQFGPRSNLRSIVETVREYLGVSLQTQTAWKDTNAALKEWREANGVFVFKDAFRQDDIFGFCVYDDEFPVIYINNSTASAGRQIFTLFHELTHLLLKTGGIDRDDRTLLRRVAGDSRRIEILCNQFVGEFLVPASDFDEQVSGSAINDEIVGKLANRYKVSWEVVLRRCLDKRLISQQYYHAKRQEAIEKAARKRYGTQGGNYYYNQALYLGNSYLSLVFSRYYQGKFPVQQLAEYLNVKVNHIPDLEAVFLGRG